MGNYCTCFSQSPPSPSLPPPSLPPPCSPSSPSSPFVDPLEADLYATATYENTPLYTMKGERRMVKVLRVVDGDTVDIALYHLGEKRIYRHRVRLYGIDTPEKRPSKSDPYREQEIQASIHAKIALEGRIQENDGIVLALFYETDKYGRLMCTFYDKQGEDINDWMIKKGFAQPYFGKTKKKFVPSSFEEEKRSSNETE